MQFSLKEFAAEISRGTVALGDKTYDIRALTGAELRAVQRTRPRPTPPRKVPPDRGSLAEAVPDPSDGAYRQEQEAWLFYFQVVAAAVGLGHLVDGKPWPGAGGEPAVLKAWAERAYAELAGALSDQELGVIFSAVDALGLARLVGKAAGDSSAPHQIQASTALTASSPSSTGSPSPA